MAKKHNRPRSYKNQVPVAQTFFVKPAMQHVQGLLKYTIVFIIAASLYHLVEWVTRANDPSNSISFWFSGVNQYYLWHILALGGYIPFMIIGIVPRFKIADIKDFGGEDMAKQIVLGFGLIVVTQVVFGFILQPIIGIVSPIEMVFFFAFGGIMEEVLYRLFIMNVISGIIRKAGGKRLKNDYYISGGVALAVSSIIFMLAHIAVYGTSPSKMLGALMLGFTFGFVYLISNNLFVPMLIHFINNAFAEVMDLSRGGAALLQAGQSSTMGDLSYALVSCVVIIMAFGIYSIYKWVRMTRQGKPTENTMTLEMAGELNLQQTQQAQTTKQTSFIKRNAKWLIFITLVIFIFIVGGMLGMYDGFQPIAGGLP